MELCSAQFESQEDRGWEESSLARFNNFLGFSTEGLEKDILDFFFISKLEKEEREFIVKVYWRNQNLKGS